MTDFFVIHIFIAREGGIFYDREADRQAGGRSSQPPQRRVRQTFATLLVLTGFVGCDAQPCVDFIRAKTQDALEFSHPPRSH